MSPIQSFRSDDNLRAQLSELLADEVMTRALFVIRDSVSNDDVEVQSDPIVSVRLLSRRAGWIAALNELLSLTEPLPGPPDQMGPETWGVPETET